MISLIKIGGVQQWLQQWLRPVRVAGVVQNIHLVQDALQQNLCRLCPCEIPLILEFQADMESLFLYHEH